MRWIPGIAIGVLSTVALSACGGGMDVAECRAADWYAIGYEDGVQGKEPAYFGDRRKACAEHGVRADFASYTSGRSQGLTEFCRPHNGFRLGTRGYHYSGICPPALEGAFLNAHADGYGLYERRVAVAHISKQLNNSHKRAKIVERDIAEKSAQLVAAETLPQRRATLVVDLKQLAEEKVRLEHAIRQLEHDREQAEIDYARHKGYIASRQSD